MMRKRDLDLHLLPCRHAPVERPGVIENSVDQRVVLVANRPRELATDEDVGKIGDKGKIRISIEEIESKIQIRRHTIAVGLVIDGQPTCLDELLPAVNQREALIQPSRTHVGLQVDVMHAEFAGDIQDRLKVFHGLRTPAPR